MRIRQIDLAIEECRQHLASCNASGTIIENYLTQFLLIKIVSELERQIQQIILSRFRGENKALNGFIENCIERSYRSARVDDIKALLKRCGPECHSEFKNKVDSNPRIVTSYGNLITHRNSAAHSEGANVTLEETIRFYEEGHVVLDFMQNALSQILE